MATADELIMQITGEDYHEDLQFIIDENLRTIAIPKDGVVLGVCGDKDINRVNFRMNRYYNGFDLSEFNVRINYINPNGEPNYFVVTDIQVDVDYIIFTWLVEAHATRYVGEVSFCVRLFTESEGKIDSQFFSTIGKAAVLENIDVDSSVPEEEVVDMITKLINDVLKEIGGGGATESEIYQGAVDAGYIGTPYEFGQQLYGLLVSGSGKKSIVTAIASKAKSYAIPTSASAVKIEE